MRIGLAACSFAVSVGSLAAFQTPQAPQAPQAQTVQVAGSIEGQVFNLATGAPLKRANVRLTAIGRGGRGPGGPGGRGGTPFVGPQQQARETDDQGRFVFSNLEAGRYYLSAERQGFLRQNYRGRKHNASGTAIVGGADRRRNNLVMKMNPQSVIAGKGYDADGEPAANLQVRAYKQGYRNGKKQWVQAGNGTTSD